MAIRIRKVKNERTTGGFGYIALCAAKNKYEKGDIYLNDSLDHALRMKFLEDYTEEGLIKKSQKEISLMNILNGDFTHSIICKACNGTGQVK